jgi:hypothetical protein
MQARDGETEQDEPDEPTGEPQTKGEGSTNYPWYLPSKEKTAWKPGDEPGLASFLEAFNQGRSFNEKLERGREDQTGGLDVSTPIAKVVLLLVVAWTVQVAWSQLAPY